jgi:serine/threonine-protein kinase
VALVAAPIFSTMPTALFGQILQMVKEPEELAPGRAVGEWRIERHIADGGMGRVYSAVHPVLDKRVAIKVLHEGFAGDVAAVMRFREEARIVSRINHRNLVDVYAFGTLSDGRPYFVMEWLDGQTLERHLRRGPLPLRQAADVVDQVACALEAAHAHAVIHRDVKPENIILVPAGDRTLVKLVDFGVAKLSRSGARPTTTGVLGTPEYFSPEQARGGTIDPRSDVYSLGLVLFEAVIGRRAIRGDNPLALAYQHLHTPAPRLRLHWPAAPEPLDELVARMLEKDATHRPSMAEVRASLWRILDRAPPPARLRWPRTLLFASSVSVALGAGLWFGAHRLPPPAPIVMAASAPPPASMCEPPPRPPRPRLVLHKPRAQN